MAKYNTVNGIILSRLEYKDSDGIYSIFTKEFGKLPVLAKGIKKPKSKFASFMQLGAVLKIELIGDLEKMPILKGVKAVLLPEIHQYEELILFEKALELTKCFCQEGHALSHVFDLLSDFLKYFPNYKKKEILIIAFEIKLLTTLGFINSFKYCVKCSNKLSEEAHFFDVSKGVICGKCVEDDSFISVSFNEIKVLAFLQEQSFFNIEKLDIGNELLKAISEKIGMIRKGHVERDLRTELVT